jgi:hypothetical protein
LRLVECVFKAGQVEHAQGDAGAFEDVLITPTPFMQLALAAAHVQQRDHRQHGKARPSRHLPMKAGSSSSSTRCRSNNPRSCQSLLLKGTVSTLLATSSWVSVPGLTREGLHRD